METFQLEDYLDKGVENIVKGIMKASLRNPKATLFMMQYAAAGKQARKKRAEAEAKGFHIPPFLIASITDSCNLHCKGCYARANHSCQDVEDISKSKLLSEGQWNHIFEQAVELGIGFILLAGGEPFMRKAVLEVAGRHKDILFPVFTNGTVMNEEYIKLLDRDRNLIPVLSIEGNEETTDARRGPGIYERLEATMDILHNKRILFGTSVTVTKENMEEVFSDRFAKRLADRGAKAVIYVEYVPVDESTESLEVDDEDRKHMEERLNRLRIEMEEMLFVSFPGDEKSSGGCLAAGRGFFHINARGGAEPCPFSPFSDTSVLKTSLKEALSSPLFINLQRQGNLTEDHTGGCVLFRQEKQVRAMAAEEEG